MSTYNEGDLVNVTGWSENWDGPAVVVRDNKWNVSVTPIYGQFAGTTGAFSHRYLSPVTYKAGDKVVLTSVGAHDSGGEMSEGDVITLGRESHNVKGWWEISEYGDGGLFTEASFVPVDPSVTISEPETVTLTLTKAEASLVMDVLQEYVQDASEEITLSRSILDRLDP